MLTQMLPLKAVYLSMFILLLYIKVTFIYTNSKNKGI